LTDVGEAGPGILENLFKSDELSMDKKFTHPVQTFDTREIPVASSPSKQLILKHELMNVMISTSDEIQLS